MKELFEFVAGATDLTLQVARDWVALLARGAEWLSELDWRAIVTGTIPLILAGLVLKLLGMAAP